MAGDAERTGIKVARWLKEKSAVVAGGALLVGLLVPSLATIAIGVAALEGVEYAGSRWYEKKYGSKQVTMQPGKEYAIA